MCELSHGTLAKRLGLFLNFAFADSQQRSSLLGLEMIVFEFLHGAAFPGHLQIRVIHDDLNLVSLVRSGLMIRFERLEFLELSSWPQSSSDHLRFGNKFALADSRPALF